MKARTTTGMFLVLLLAVAGLAYGVGQAAGPSDAAGPASHPTMHRTNHPATDPATDPAPTTTTDGAATGGLVVRPVQDVAPRHAPLRVRPELVPGRRLLGPGDHGPQVRALQARLRQIAWLSGDVDDVYDATVTAAVRGFQAKRGIAVTGYVDPRTRHRLDAMTHAPTTAELENRLTPMGNTPGRLDPRCRTGRAICIDKSSRTLRWVVDGQVLRTVDVRFGASYTPTREGLFHVYWMDADHVSHEYGSAMPYSMFFSRGQAVHYSSDFAARGYAGASHGCVNVRDHEGVKWLFSHVRVGDKVVIYWS
ncbi:L,D-transpeptidase family protein [Nocardioides terrisoli]|uniref:L,D-transpeptidase family protein n=1 Tax=Nocardioides terrisoli TaxID=3388267 RepID=UPI00287B6A2D|nr:L,D-transpeptidase family protein [Nocardioides marmorisolisilvae]